MQLKGETAGWTSVPQKAANTQIPHPWFYVMMATLSGRPKPQPEIIPIPAVAETIRTGNGQSLYT
jgi:hypothetical protein